MQSARMHFRGAEHRDNPAGEGVAANTLVRIVARNLYDPARKIPPHVWEARTETGDLLVARTRQPFLDGARALLAAGHDPAELVTMRIAGKSFDSFKPVRLAKAASLAAEEGDRSVRLRRWKDQAGRAAPVVDEVDLPASADSRVSQATPEPHALGERESTPPAEDAA